jgi:hypothetical protein
MKTTETNCETGETIERDMTPEEEEAYNIALNERIAIEAELAAKVAARTSALAKLQAIGLTEEEALAIVG